MVLWRIIMKKLLISLSFMLYASHMQASAPLASMPPTLAFLQNQTLLQAVQSTYGKDIDLHKDSLIRPILLQEARHPHHIALYHGQNSLLLIIPDFLNRLYEHKYGKKVPRDFFMLRYWPFGSKHTNVQTFLDSHNGQINDHLEEIFAQILSVNFAYFGNLHNSGSATFRYVLDNQSAFCRDTSFIHNILETIFTTEKLSTQYIDDLIKLVQEYAPALGNTYQIYLKPEAADKYLYLCCPGGMPHGAIYDTAGKIVAEHDFDATKGRYTKCSGVLKQYYTHPESIQHLDSLQGRLLLSRDCMLNPESGVKIFRYTSLTPEKEKEYQTKLDALCNKIFNPKTAL